MYILSSNINENTETEVTNYIQVIEMYGINDYLTDPLQKHNLLFHL